MWSLSALAVILFTAKTQRRRETLVCLKSYSKKLREIPRLSGKNTHTPSRPFAIFVDKKQPAPANPSVSAVKAGIPAYAEGIKITGALHMVHAFSMHFFKYLRGAAAGFAKLHISCRAATIFIKIREQKTIELQGSSEIELKTNRA